MMWIWEWRCCRWQWQLIPSKRYPERNEFKPKCPTCGAIPERTWKKVGNEEG